ncbi:MAG: 6-bladed beta-propeller [Bacteroidales bacterium]|nr:6-bladed beta-propeller [Bacteroidales bacterium]
MRYIEKSVSHILYILIILLAISCTNNIIGIDTNNDVSYEKTAINLDDYIEGEIKLISLETNDTCLVSETDKVYPTESFIYVYSSERVMQFDYNGGFIKSITRKGSGPGEITYLADCSVDSKDRNLYCVQQDEKDSIMVFNIYTGKYSGRIPNWSRSPLVAISMLNDTTLICFQRENSTGKSNLLAHVQNLKGHLISKINRNTPPVDGLVMRRRPHILSYNNDMIYLPNRGDTIYKICNYNSVEPVINITRPGKYNKYNSAFLFTGSSVLVSSTDYEMKYIGGGNVIMEPTKIGYYFVDINTKNTTIVERVFSNRLEISFSKNNLSDFFNNVSFIRSGYMSLMISNSSVDEIKGQESYIQDENKNPAILIAKLK